MRHSLKSITCFLTHFVLAVAVAYALTVNHSLAMSIGIVEPAV